MASTVVGLFDEREDAVKVVSELKEAGLDADEITFTTQTAREGGPSGTHAVTDDLGSLPSKLESLGVPDDHAQLYAEGVRRGGTLITASAEDDEVDPSAKIMRRNHVVDITKRSEVYRGEGYQTFDATATPYTEEQAATHRTEHAAHRDTLTDGDTPATLEEAEEDIEICKRQVKKGGVRIFRRVTETPVEKDVTLREEEIRVSRNKVDREAGTDAFTEGEIDVTETDEEAVVTKTARVTGEVVVDKTAKERTETVRDTVRKTEVEVEKDGGVTVQDDR